ncbi:MAG: HAD family phosphatase [Synergistaceae bacterium]|nr:HAD family phosphatase [Synergistaceae bacterium]
MDKIKLIAFDLDGTLFNDKKEVTPETLRTLEHASESGIEIVPATGRFWNAIPENVKAMKFIRYMISLNGAEVFDIKEMKSLSSFTIPIERAETMCRVFDELPVIYDFVAGGQGYMKREHYNRIPETMIGEWQVKVMTDMRRPVDDIYGALREQKGVQKMQIYTLDKTLRENLLKSLPYVFPNVLFTSSVPNNIEINDTKANKGDGLKFLAGYLGIPLESTLAFGDGLNDISMIKAAGIGAAMSNAVDELKESADYIVPDCNTDGVAEGIKRFCFGQY